MAKYKADLAKSIAKELRNFNDQLLGMSQIYEHAVRASDAFLLDMAKELATEPENRQAYQAGKGYLAYINANEVVLDESLAERLETAQRTAASDRSHHKWKGVSLRGRVYKLRGTTTGTPRSLLRS